MHKLAYMLILLFASCSEISQVSQVSHSGFGAFEADLEVLADNIIAISWYDTRDPHGEIYLRLLDAELAPLSAELRLTENQADSYEVDIVALGETIAATWYEVDSAQQSRVMLGLWDQQGKQLWKKTLSSSMVNARIPVIAVSQAELFVAWLESDLVNGGEESSHYISAVWIDSQGDELSRFPKLASASQTTWNLNADLQEVNGSTQILLAYDAEYETFSSELYVTEILQGETRTNRLSDDDGYPSKYPDIVSRGNKVALSWFDNLFGSNEIYLATQTIPELFSEAIDLRFELEARRVTNSQADSIGAYLAWSENDLALAWSDKQTGSYEIYFQRFDSEANFVSEIQRLSRTGADSLIPSISAFRDEFVIAWNAVTVNAHEENSRLSRSEIKASLAH